MDEGTASRFVSSGTVDQPIDRDEEWKRAQQELEETRRKKYEQDQEQDGRSLYEVLQANKGTKDVYPTASSSSVPDVNNDQVGSGASPSSG